MKNTTQDYEKMEELYELYEQKIYYVAYSVVRNIQQAEDIVQEVFITLYNHLDTWSNLDTQELKRYILRIAKNKAIDSYRKNKRQGMLVEEYQREISDAVNENINEWEQQIIAENQIDSLLPVLNESCRQVFKYKIFYNFSYQEISKIMGLSEVNLRKQFERARKLLHKRMGGIQSEGFTEFKRNV